MEPTEHTEQTEYTEQAEQSENAVRNGEEQATLEEIFAELDEVLAAMDDRVVSMEDSFALYEKGMKTVRRCYDKLDSVEKKMLMIAEDGSEVPFEE